MTPIAVTTSSSGKYKIAVGTKQQIVDYIESNKTSGIKIIQFIASDAANDEYTLLATFN